METHGKPHSLYIAKLTVSPNTGRTEGMAGMAITPEPAPSLLPARLGRSVTRAHTLRAAALSLLGGSLTELTNLHADAKDGMLTVAVWKKMWEAHAKAAQKVLTSMEKALAKYPGSETESELLRAQFQPVVMQVAEALEAAKKAVLEPSTVTLKRKRGKGGGVEEPLEGALKVLKDHSYDMKAAAAQTGKQFLTVAQLRALASHKKIGGLGKLSKKEEIVTHLITAGAFATERAAL